jgi:hypothetical protein
MQGPPSSPAIKLSCFLYVPHWECDMKRRHGIMLRCHGRSNPLAGRLCMWSVCSDPTRMCTLLVYTGPDRCYDCLFRCNQLYACGQRVAGGVCGNASPRLNQNNPSAQDYCITAIVSALRFQRCRRCLLLHTIATAVADATEAHDTKQVCGAELVWITCLNPMLKYQEALDPVTCTDCTIDVKC